MKGRNLALLSAFCATLIYALNYSIAKDVMPLYIKPFGFIILRLSGALVLFWIASFFIKKEKIERKDFIPIFFAALFGAAFNMLTFFKGLSLTTPINAAVIMVTTPILVFILSLIFLQEKLIKRRIIGVVIGLIGAIILIYYGPKSAVNAPNIFLGNIYVFINASLYAFYMIIVKKLIGKYHPLTFVKWMYLFGLIIVIPFGYNELMEVEWNNMPINIYYAVLFVVIGTTFLTYLFNLLALTKLKPTTVSSFVYLQPVITTVFALLLKSDTLNIVKIVAAILIFLGVYLVSKPAKQNA
ncbi:DMT family transporter [Urechidicola croceus]|uniref:Multidrug transporter n=1 Tax=Urechidicola croceus TaxID=1850246 RepID=A0A1D8P9Y4_9FLAO|nr:DMT family transporter [Urechidicola croceus]AOW21375.1 multidrug transporter [Urechidicola croceus]